MFILLCHLIALLRVSVAAKKKNLITEMSTVGIFVCINTSQCCHAHMHHKSIFVAEIQFTTRKTLFLLIEQTAHGAVTQGRYHSL